MKACLILCVGLFSIPLFAETSVLPSIHSAVLATGARPAGNYLGKWGAPGAGEKFEGARLKHSTQAAALSGRVGPDGISKEAIVSDVKAVIDPKTMQSNPRFPDKEMYTEFQVSCEESKEGEEKINRSVQAEIYVYGNRIELFSKFLGNMRVNQPLDESKVRTSGAFGYDWIGDSAGYGKVNVAMNAIGGGHFSFRFDWTVRGERHVLYCQ